MNTDRSNAGVLGWLWQFFMGASEAAVAIHYRAPWSLSE
jgi:hypothetical protein